MEQYYPPIVEVNDIGNVIGPVSYELAHPKDPLVPGIRHQSANIFVWENPERKRLYLTRRSGNVSRPGVLNVCAGGHSIWLEYLNRAQTPLETAYNETIEELFHNISSPITPSQLSYVTCFKKDLRLNDPEFVHLYELIYPGPFNINPKEVSDAFFVNLDDVLYDTKHHPENYVKSAKLYLEKLLV